MSNVGVIYFTICCLIAVRGYALSRNTLAKYTLIALGIAFAMLPVAAFVSPSFLDPFLLIFHLGGLGAGIVLFGLHLYQSHNTRSIFKIVYVAFALIAVLAYCVKVLQLTYDGRFILLVFVMTLATMVMLAFEKSWQVGYDKLNIIGLFIAIDLHVALPWLMKILYS